MSTLNKQAFQVAQGVKKPSVITGASGDRDLTLGSGRSSGGGNGNPLQYSCLGNPIGRGTWRATVHGVTKELDTDIFYYGEQEIFCVMLLSIDRNPD